MKGVQTQAAEDRVMGVPPNDAEDMMPARFPPTREACYLLPRSNAPIRMPLPMRKSGWPGVGESEKLHRAEELTRDDHVSRALVYRVPDSREKAAAVDRFAALTNLSGSNELGGALADDAIALPLPAPVPAWLSGPEDAELNGYLAADGDRQTSSLPETLEGSRERMASRRFGLNQALQGEKPEVRRNLETSHTKRVRAQLIMVFSMAGGVGKTSLVATLGRALSFAGEKVFLADATSHGLLPFYYGAKEPLPPAVHRFAPPAERPGNPVQLLTLNVNECSATATKVLSAELAREHEEATCILLDTSGMAASMLNCFTGLDVRVLVPLAPDMNSVITLAAVEKVFTELGTGSEQALQPVYLLIGFDASEALHLDVREVLRQQLGARLLPFVIRRSSAVAEALAEGMTVIDYAPEAGVANDYMDVAQWVCSKPGEFPLSRQGTLWNER